MFVAVQLLEDTPAVLTLGKLCGEKWVFIRVERRTSTKSCEQMAKLYFATVTTSCQSSFRSRKKHLTRSAEDSPENTKKLTLDEEETTKASRGRLQDFPEWLQEFKKILVEPRSASSGCDSKDPPEPHRPESLPFNAPKGSTLVHPLSQKIQIVSCASVRKLRGDVADVIHKVSHSARPSSVISLLPTTKSSLKKRNRGTIKGMQLLCKFGPPNGFTVTPCTQAAARNVRKFLELKENSIVIWTSLSRSSMEPLHVYTSSAGEQNGIAVSAVGRFKEGTSTTLLQSRLDEQWWAESIERYCYPRSVRDLLSDGKLHMNGVLKNISLDQSYHAEQKSPISTKDRARLHL